MDTATWNEAAAAYGQRRADETGTQYFETAMGHVLADLGDNRQLADDLGGIVRVFLPAK